MPTENRVRRDDGGNLAEYFSAKLLPLHGENPPLSISQTKSSRSKLLLENAILRDEVVDDPELMLVHPSGETEKQKVKGLEKEAHPVKSTKY